MSSTVVWELFSDMPSRVIHRYYADYEVIGEVWEDMIAPESSVDRIQYAVIVGGVYQDNDNRPDRSISEVEARALAEGEMRMYLELAAE